jgi:hypothetical protein
MTDKTIDDAIQFYTTFYNAPKAVLVRLLIDTFPELCCLRLIGTDMIVLSNRICYMELLLLVYWPLSQNFTNGMKVPCSSTVPRWVCSFSPLFWFSKFTDSR